MWPTHWSISSIAQTFTTWCSWIFTLAPGIEPVCLTWEWHIHVSMEHLNQLGCLWPWSCTHVQDLHQIACKWTLQNKIFLWKKRYFSKPQGKKFYKGAHGRKNNKHKMHKALTDVLILTSKSGFYLMVGLNLHEERRDHTDGLLSADVALPWQTQTWCSSLHFYKGYWHCVVLTFFSTTDQDHILWLRPMFKTALL